MKTQQKTIKKMKEKYSLGLNEIKKLLPHRPPFLFVDKVIDYIPFKYCNAIKDLPKNDTSFDGHFPGNPIFPGVLQIEAVAQAAGISLSSKDKPLQPLLVKVNKAKFIHTITSGCCLIIKTEILSIIHSFAKVKGIISTIDSDNIKKKASETEIIVTYKK